VYFHVSIIEKKDTVISNNHLKLCNFPDASIDRSTLHDKPHLENTYNNRRMVIVNTDGINNARWFRIFPFRFGRVWIGNRESRNPTKLYAGL